MSRRRLLLVDLDNVLDALGGAEEVRRCPSAVPNEDRSWLAPSDAPVPQDGPNACIVVLGLNLATAQNTAGLDVLEGFASRLAYFAADASQYELEVALTPTAPEAVDRLLERLSREAPSSAHAGDFDDVYLMSRDRGLRSSLAIDLGWGAAKSMAGGLLYRWAAPAGRFRTRTCLRPVGSSKAGTSSPPAGSANIVAGRWSGWAAEQPVELSSGSDLPSVAAEILDNPGVMTQVAATQRCLRGLDRLLEHLQHGQTLVGGNANKDGIELRCRALPVAVHRGKCGRSSLGPGAARVSGPDGTVLCVLPPGVARQAPYLDLVNGSAVKSSTLDGFTSGARLEGKAKIELRAQGSQLLAEVLSPGFASYHQHWWVIGKKATAKLKLPNLGHLAQRRGRTSGVAGVFTVLGPAGERSVGFRPPFDGAQEVVIEEAIEPSRLGIAVLGSNRVVVLAPDDRAVHGVQRVRPIQDITGSQLAATNPSLHDIEALQRLPIAVIA